MLRDVARKEHFALAIEVGSAFNLALGIRIVVGILAVRSFILIVC